ncbi:hypothetical protein [Flagellimonas crocea]|uniref:hypothetical protein n=1 Tax=Flagellimonas crocea TaxID=3067311 RepID=UPI00296EFCC9|nr:hypothetical protein [Muricauda sp. DH64]
MRKLVIPFIALAIASSCDIKKEEKGEMPEVDVDVTTEAGELPEYDVDWAEVDVSTTTKTVKVPKPIIVMEEEEVEVPVIDFNMPNEDNEERTIMVEAEISGNDHELDIKEIRASQNRLYVISTLEKLDTDIGDKKMRIQDQVELNAPDLDVKHIIVGEKADNILNNQYTYVDSMSDMKDEVKNAQVIYSGS